MFELLKEAKQHQPFVCLNAAFRSDLAWWHCFLKDWNGVPMLIDVSYVPDQHLYSDASGALGCGAWAGCHWLQYLWPENYSSQSIAT